MLTLRRQNEEAVPSLTNWLTSENPVEQQYATLCLAEMGDTYGTDCLILLASLEDKKRRRNCHLMLSLLIGLLCPLLIALMAAAKLSLCGMLMSIPVRLILNRKAKASQLQQMAVEKLAEGRNPAAAGALIDALWRAEPVLREVALQGLVKLLPRVGKDIRLSEKQWNFLLQEISPERLSQQKTTLDDKFVLAIFQAVASAGYLPAVARIRRLSESRKTFWKDAMIRSNAVQCSAILEQARLRKSSVQFVRTQP